MLPLHQITKVMSDHSLSAISPVDGRYGSQTAQLTVWFSEAALIRFRVKVEIEYFKALCDIPLPQLAEIKPADLLYLTTISDNFSPADAEHVKKLEATTNHDVKAVEYFIKDKLKGTTLEKYSEFIHFGLTSQDINNTAMPMMIKGAVEEVMMPQIDLVNQKLSELAKEWKDIPMMAYTHGQPASPTHLGKELYVFVSRLEPMVEELKTFRYSGKFGGATGNFNAHKAAYPGINWVSFSEKFLEKNLGLARHKVTTQIDHYDDLAALFYLFIRINNVLLDLNRDVWSYISMNVFTQKIKEGEIGSSAMPHKVNPIDFENSEGNIGVAKALFSFMAEKLPVSRLQRDLTDSTVTRNIGVPFAHTLIALKSLAKGLGKLLVNEQEIRKALNDNWAVVSEGIQTILRREGVAEPYEILKGLTRGNPHVTKESLHAFVDTLPVSNEVKEELKSLSPETYTGYTHRELLNS